MAHSICEVYLHVVFSTKNRMPWILPEIEDRVFPYLGGVARRKKVVTLSINGTKDHVHLLQKLHACVSIAKLVGDMKSYSSTFIKKLGILEFCWQEGYGVFSISKSHINSVTRYTERQKEHHRKTTFDDEMKRFAEVWGFEWLYDE